MEIPEGGVVDFSEDDVVAKWLEISPLIDRVQERVGDRDDFPVLPRSSLAGDDKASSPFQVSHVVRMAFTAGIDHLHAVKHLAVDSQVLHVAAPHSLSRGALENFAAAFWILHPTNRNERITRALRWHVQNLKDQDKVLGVRGPGAPTFEEKRARVYEVADQRGLSREKIGTGYTSTAAVNYADEHSRASVKFAWQLCSGFAHGRPWAHLGASEREEFETDEPGVRHIRMTSSLTTVLFPALEALHLLQDVLRNHALRSGVPLV